MCISWHTDRSVSLSSFFANFAVDNKILNHYNMKAKVVDNRYLFF